MKSPPKDTRSLGPSRSRAWAARALLALVAIVGVLAMHGLTMNHDPAMSGLDTTNAHAMALMGETTSADHLAVRVADETVVQVGPVLASVVQDERGLTGVCLAYLAALVLLLGGAGQMVAAARADEALVGRGVVAWASTARTRASPDLAELSVLRT